MRRSNAVGHGATTEPSAGRQCDVTAAVPASAPSYLTSSVPAKDTCSGASVSACRLGRRARDLVDDLGSRRVVDLAVGSATSMPWRRLALPTRVCVSGPSSRRPFFDSERVSRAAGRVTATPDESFGCADAGAAVVLSACFESDADDSEDDESGRQPTQSPATPYPVTTAAPTPEQPRDPRRDRRTAQLSCTLLITPTTARPGGFREHADSSTGFRRGLTG